MADTTFFVFIMASPCNRRPKAFCCSFVAQLFLDDLKAGTVKSYLAAVRHEQIGLGLGDPHMPDMPQLKYTIKGLKRKAVNGATRPHLPITPKILGALKQVWSRDLDRFSASMLWAACCLCFFGFLRSAEVVVPSDTSFDAGVHLCFGDITVDSHFEPSTLRVTLKASKTDPRGSSS